MGDSVDGHDAGALFLMVAANFWRRASISSFGRPWMMALLSADSARKTGNGGFLGGRCLAGSDIWGPWVQLRKQGALVIGVGHLVAKGVWSTVAGGLADCRKTNRRATGISRRGCSGWGCLAEGWICRRRLKRGRRSMGCGFRFCWI
jgi:hypothetical protein